MYAYVAMRMYSYSCVYVAQAMVAEIRATQSTFAFGICFLSIENFTIGIGLIETQRTSNHLIQFEMGLQKNNNKKSEPQNRQKTVEAQK